MWKVSKTITILLLLIPLSSALGAPEKNVRQENTLIKSGAALGSLYGAYRLGRWIERKSLTRGQNCAAASSKLSPQRAARVPDGEVSEPGPIRELSDSEMDRLLSRLTEPLPVGNERLLWHHRITSEILPEYMTKIMEIEKSSFRNPWSKEEFELNLTYPNIRAWVFSYNEQIAGYSVVGLAPDGAHIMKFAIKEKFRNLELGTDFLNGIFQNLRWHGEHTVFADVEQDNKGAQLFLQSLGFKLIDKVNEDYRFRLNLNE